MKRFMSRRNLTRRFSGRGVSVVGTAMLVGGLLLPISPASADIVAATITVGADARHIAINPAGTFAYVTHGDSHIVSRINLATDKVDATIDFGGWAAWTVTINPAGTFAYVTSSKDVFRINLATNAVDAKLDNSSPVFTAINPAGTFAYVTNYRSNGVAKFNLATHTWIEQIYPIYLFPNGRNSSPLAIAINPAGTFAYVTLEYGPVARINLATNKVDATITVGADASYIAINPAGTFAYVNNIESNTLSRINLATNTVDATIAVGAKPAGVAIDPTGRFAYVTNSDAGTVSRINLATNTVDATIAVGAKPLAVAINPAGTFAYVTNSGAGTVSKIKLDNALPLVTTAEPAVQSVSAKELARVTAKLAVPKGATVTLRVDPASSEFCSVSTTKSGTFLNYLKDGLCKVTVTVNTKINKVFRKTVVIDTNAVRG